MSDLLISLYSKAYVAAAFTIFGLMALTGCASIRDMDYEETHRVALERVVEVQERGFSARLDQLSDSIRNLERKLAATGRTMESNDQALSILINEEIRRVDELENWRDAPPNNNPPRAPKPKVVKIKPKRTEQQLPTLGGAYR